MVNGRCGIVGADCYGKVDGTACGENDDENVCQRGDCVPPPCGDGIRNGDDECEGADLGRETCTSFAGTYGGQLACTADCRIDTSGCTGECGDRRLDPDHETCDPTDFDPATAPTCVSRGQDAGRLECREDCSGLSEAPCMRLGWSYETTSDDGRPIGVVRDLWGVGGDLIALVDPGGVRTTTSDDVVGWGPVGLEGPLIHGEAVWASSMRDIWVLVDGAGFRHWDGERWTQVAAPLVGLLDLWGRGQDDVFAVGREGVVHYDGARWSVERTPTGAELRAVWGAGDTVYAVGVAGRLLRRDQRGWAAIESGTTETLVGVWADSSANLWTVSATSARRFDGRRWRTVATFESDERGMAWIGGTGAHDVWISAGSGGEVRRHDGTAWSTLRAATQTNAQALWVDEHAVAVGHENGEDAAMARWFGAGSGPLLATAGDFHDVWGAGRDLWIAVGTNRDTGLGLALHSDGRRFDFPEQLTTVTGFEDGRAYAASNDGTFYGWDGQAWSPALPPNEEQYIDLWTVGETDVYALLQQGGSAARVIRFDGERATQLPALDRECGVIAVAGWSSGPGDVFVVGTDMLARFDGTRWTCHDGAEVGQPFASIWGSGPDDVWVYQAIGGEGGQARLHHWDGSAWADQATVGAGALVGTAPDDVFLGRSMHFDGHAWTPLRILSMPGLVVHATPGRLFTISPVFESGGLGQFVRTRFWNGRSRERDCGDGVDDDGDGRTDGDDTDCAPARGAAAR